MSEIEILKKKNDELEAKLKDELEKKQEIEAKIFAYDVYVGELKNEINRYENGLKEAQKLSEKLLTEQAEIIQNKELVLNLAENRIKELEENQPAWVEDKKWVESLEKKLQETEEEVEKYSKLFNENYTIKSQTLANEKLLEDENQKLKEKLEELEKKNVKEKLKINESVEEITNLNKRIEGLENDLEKSLERETELETEKQIISLGKTKRELAVIQRVEQQQQQQQQEEEEEEEEIRNLRRRLAKVELDNQRLQSEQETLLKQLENAKPWISRSNSVSSVPRSPVEQENLGNLWGPGGSFRRQSSTSSNSAVITEEPESMPSDIPIEEFRNMIALMQQERSELLEDKKALEGKIEDLKAELEQQDIEYSKKITKLSEEKEELRNRYSPPSSIGRSVMDRFPTIDTSMPMCRSISSLSTVGETNDDNQWELDETEKNRLETIQRLREKLERMTADYIEVKKELEVKSLLVKSSTNKELLVEMARVEEEERKSKLWEKYCELEAENKKLQQEIKSGKGTKCFDDDHKNFFWEKKALEKKLFSAEVEISELKKTDAIFLEKELAKIKSLLKEREALIKDLKDQEKKTESEKKLIKTI